MLLGWWVFYCFSLATAQSIHFHLYYYIFVSSSDTVSQGAGMMLYIGKFHCFWMLCRFSLLRDIAYISVQESDWLLRNNGYN